MGADDELNLGDITDEELLTRAAEGDESAFGVFCSRVLPTIVHRLRYSCKTFGLPEDYAEDAVQSALLDSVKFIRTHPKALTPGLIYIISKRHLLKFVRKNSRLATQLRVQASLEDVTNPDQISVEHAFVIREAFDLLPPTDRMLLTLILLEDKPRREVARILGSTLGGVQKRYYRSVSKLRDLLSDMLTSE
jgi:RNA polymerase sigma factor (sigma-70 family)